MTREQFIYALTACGCLLKDGKTWYEHNELIKCFEDLGLFEQEPKTGHWEWLRCDMYVCSECKNVYTDLSGIKDGMNYCPNCGAKMVEPQESED